MKTRNVSYLSSLFVFQSYFFFSPNTFSLSLLVFFFFCIFISVFVQNSTPMFTVMYKNLYRNLRFTFTLKKRVSFSDWLHYFTHFFIFKNDIFKYLQFTYLPCLFFFFSFFFLQPLKRCRLIADGSYIIFGT